MNVKDESCPAKTVAMRRLLVDLLVEVVNLYKKPTYQVNLGQTMFYKMMCPLLDTEFFFFFFFNCYIMPYGKWHRIQGMPQGCCEGGG